MIKFFLFIALALTQSYAVICDGYGDFVAYGGHYYTTTQNRLKFTDAKVLAENSGGYLAIPDTQAENDFLKSLIPGGEFSWIGIYDPSYSDSYCYSSAGCSTNDTRFKTVKGAALSYKNWMQYQPDNAVWENDVFNGTQMVLPLGESWVAMAYSGFWQDEGNHASDNNNPVKHTAIFEFDTMPECYQAPSTVTDQIAGTKCQTQIYDSTVGVVENGQAYDCQVDQYGNNYCPAALAACGQTWTYQDGYSVAVGATTTDYTSKTGSVSTYAATASTAFGWDGCQGGDKNWQNATNYCASKGMRLPYSNEIVGGGGNVPSCSSSNYSWTASPDSYGDGFYTVWMSKNMVPYVVAYEDIQYNINYGVRCAGNVTTYTCLSGGTLSGSTCTVNTLACPTGYTATSGAETAKGECKKSVNYTYYNYLCSTGTPVTTGGNCTKTDPSGTTDNTATLSSACNSSTPPTNNCKAQKFTCVSAPDRPCSYVNNSWQCSPFPCFAGDSFETTDTPVGINDANNNGWDNGGNCLGQLYIFNGKDSRCRNDDAFFGLFGGGCCDKDKVFAGLIQCKEDEKKLAKLNKNGQTHYIGEYCSKKLNLGFTKICIQHKQTYCAFNGKLARIINEQGRPQLGKGWGIAESPDCRGFTPEEFQKLDFSEIDMSEFFKDIGQTMSASIVNNANTYIQTKVSGILKQ